MKHALILFLALFFSLTAHAFEVEGMMDNNGDGTYNVSLDNNHGVTYNGYAHYQENGENLNVVVKNEAGEVLTGVAADNGLGSYDLHLHNTESGQEVFGFLDQE